MTADNVSPPTTNAGAMPGPPHDAASVLLDGLAIGAALVNRDGYCEYANQALLDLLDCTLAEVVAVPLHDLIHFDKINCPACGETRCRFEQAIRSDSAQEETFETIFCRRHGPPFIAACHTRPVRQGEQRLIALEVRDVSRDRQAELVSRTQELAYRFAANAAKHGSWMRDLRTNRVTICPVMAQLLGLPAEQSVQSAAQWSDMILPEDLPRVEAEVAEAIATDRQFVVEFGLRLPNGERRWHLSRGMAVKDSAGRPVGMVGMSVDITEKRRAEQALAASEARFRLLAEMSPAAIFVIVDGRIVYANQVAADILGVVDADALLGRSPLDMVDETDRAAAAERMQAALAQGTVPLTEIEVHRSDGKRIWVQSTSGTVLWEGQPAVQIIARDITEEKQTRDKLRIMNERFNLALESAGQAVWDWNLASDTYTIAGGLKSLFGWADELDHAAHIDWDTVVHPDDIKRVRIAMQACLDGETQVYQCEFRLRARDGSWRWVLSRGAIVERNAQGKPLALTGTVVDVTARKESEDLAWRHAHLDPLTDLPNRRLYRERLNLELRKAGRSGRSLALLFIDLDRFKQVNDWLGHEAGDKLLVEAAHRLRGCVRQTDTVARLGGDEFTVMLADLEHAHHVEFVCQKILETLSEPFHINGDLAYISGSIGVALFPEDATSADELMRKADQAMYAAKQSGREQFKYFTKSMDESAHRRLQITTELRHAISNGQLAVHYQPVVRLSDREVVKAEALARWRHPWLGDVLPSIFIPLAEEAGFIGQIGSWVLQQVAQQSAAWRDRAGQAVQISVNQSPLQFAAGNARSDPLRALIESGFDGNHIAIEITEGALLDPSPWVTEKLLLYRDAGIQVAIDDFGTGYSSMAYLQRFHIDYLKIDQSFVRDIVSNAAHRTIAETIIVMAHKLGLEVVAEGIENEAQMECLRDAGCDYGQGFLFAPALPAADFERILSGGSLNAPAALH